MTIFQVNGYNNQSTFYVDQATYDANSATFKGGTLVVGTQADADAKLATLQASVLAYEAVRFSMCATFVNGNDSVWREVVSTDPEDTVCQVFNTFTGQYTSYPNQTEAKAANAALQAQFLDSIGLGAVTSPSALPVPPVQPKSTGTQTV